MIKGRVLVTLLAVLSLAGLLAISGAAQEPVGMVEGDPLAAEAPSSPANIGLSSVDSVSPSQILIQMDYDLCFDVTVDSDDLEYLDRFEVDLPDNWTIVGVYPEPANSDCGASTTEGQEAGNVVYWQTEGFPTTCAAWFNGTYDFCVEISVPDCSGEPWSLAWHMVGDGYGAPPHELSGSVGPLYCRPLGIYLTPDNLLSSGCPGDPKDFTLNLLNYTLADTTLDISYGVSTGPATLTGPDQIYLGHGVDQDFIVTLTPGICLRPGDEVLAWALAEDSSTYDITWLYRNIISGCPDSGCQFLYLPVTLRNY
jgi:hypothetical protein